MRNKEVRCHTSNAGRARSNLTSFSDVKPKLQKDLSWSFISSGSNRFRVDFEREREISQGEEAEGALDRKSVV